MGITKKKYPWQAKATPQFMLFEPRMLFDGAGAVVATADAAPDPSNTSSTNTTDAVVLQATVEPNINPAVATTSDTNDTANPPLSAEAVLDPSITTSSMTTNTINLQSSLITQIEQVESSSDSQLLDPSEVQNLSGDSLDKLSSDVPSDADAQDLPAARVYGVLGEEKLGTQALEQWQQAQHDISAQLAGLADRADFESVMRDVFQRAGTDEQTFNANLTALRDALRNGDIKLDIEFRHDQDLQGNLAAYAANAPEGGSRIYVNSDWFNFGAGSEWMTQVMLEEYGHELDRLLNGDLDATGDEGELFSARLLDIQLSQDQSDHASIESDFAHLSIDGSNVEVQKASLNFRNAYKMVYDLNNSNVIEGSLGETAASKEQNSHNFIAKTGLTDASLGRVSITDGSNGISFSGNDVSAVTTSIGGTIYNGWISRPIKSGGIVRGFYFWTDPYFTTLQLAQTDGNQDGDGDASDNKGFLFVVDQSWFDQQIASTSKTISVNNTIDGNLGSITYGNVGSSSDRVDSSLNIVLSNSAPVAVADAADGTVGNGTAAVEAGYSVSTVDATGNVLTNDTDANNDALLLTRIGTSANTLSTVNAGSTSASGATTVTGRYGSLSVGADGSYRFVVDNNNPTVDALASGAYLTDTYTYEVTDERGANATATLTVRINGSNDAPVSSPDYNTAKESITSPTAFNGYPATGNVLSNDTDVDLGDTRTVDGITVTGSAVVGNAVVTDGTSELFFVGDNGFSANITGQALYVKVGADYFAVYSSTNSQVTLLSKTETPPSSNNWKITLSADPASYYSSAGRVAISNISSFFNTNSQVGFENSTNSVENTTQMKTATVSTSTVTGYTTISNLTGITGTIASGMTVSGTGVQEGTKVSLLTYDGNGVLTSIPRLAGQTPPLLARLNSPT